MQEEEDEHAQVKRVKLDATTTTAESELPRKDDDSSSSSMDATPRRRTNNAIAQIQDAFVGLGDVYVSALRQCFQGLVVGTEEKEVDGPAIDRAIQQVLDQINLLLPNTTTRQEEEFDELVALDAELNRELAEVKESADAAVQRIKSLRAAIAKQVLL